MCQEFVISYVAPSQERGRIILNNIPTAYPGTKTGSVKGLDLLQEKK